LRDGIGLRGYGQRNPLLEYKREGTSMFHLMNSMRDEAVVSRVLRLSAQEEGPVPNVSKAAARRLAKQLPGSDDGAPEAPALTTNVSRSGPASPPEAEPVRLPSKGDEARIFALLNEIRRNDPCPCGSGNKHKKCCYERGWTPPEEIAQVLARREQARAEGLEAQKSAQSAPVPEAATPEEAPAAVTVAAGDEARMVAHTQGLRRNDPCPCESGNKYKRCCYDENWVAPEPEASDPDVPAVSESEDASEANTAPAVAGDEESQEPETAPTELSEPGGEQESGAGV